MDYDIVPSCTRNCGDHRHELYAPSGEGAASHPSPPAGFASCVVNTSAKRAPATPASPWQENTSSESASCVVARIRIAAELPSAPASEAGTWYSASSAEA